MNKNKYGYWMPGNITGKVEADSPKAAAAKALNVHFNDVFYVSGDWQQPIGATFCNQTGQTVKIWTQK